MKYAFLLFTLLVSLSAYTANTNKSNNMPDTTVKNPPTAKPSGEPTQLDDLIRGELAALKSYDVAIKNVEDEKQKAKLREIRNEHEKAVSKLSKFVASKPELLEDTEEAGAWGNFAKTWTQTRATIGEEEGALKALKRGEQHGIDEYEEALDDESIPQRLKETIRTELIPNQKKHIETLKKFI